MTFQAAAIPVALTARSQWVLWRLETVDGRLTKVPYNARTGQKAKVNDPSTWSSFATAVGGLEVFRRNTGIGYVFAADDPFTGIDLDHCFDEGGELLEWARIIVDSVHTYWEKSQSGHGLHGIGIGTLPPRPARRRHGDVEMYDARRLFATTGDHLAGSSARIEDRGEEILALHAHVMPPPSLPLNTPRPSQPLTMDDTTILDKLFREAKGAKWEALWNGQWEAQGYGSQSQGDLALCNKLAFYTGGDAARMDGLMRRSGMMRAKWENRGDYVATTIETAISSCRAFYQAHGPANGRAPRTQAGPGNGGPADPDGGEEGRGDGDGSRKDQPRLWRQWVQILEDDGAALLWTDTAEAYFQLADGTLMAVASDTAARFFQALTDREARYQSDKWARAAGALRSWVAENGEETKVVHAAAVDFKSQRAWIGCEDGKSVYRISPERIEIVSNGTDGLFIQGGTAPVLNDPAPTGELARWLIEDTWAAPAGKLTLALLSLMLALGAENFPSRPLILGIGGKGSGKTTRLQMLGGAVTGQVAIAQSISAKDDQNEARIVNETLVIFDNLEAPPRNSDSPPEDFIASACTQQRRSIRRMRAEGEQVTKPVTAFIAATSFSTPACLKRADVIERALIVGFKKPDGADLAEMTDRAPDREKVWGDLLTLLQRVVTRWKDTPDTSALRAVGFMRIAHSLLDKADARALEASLMGFAASTAGQDDLILQALQMIEPAEPMSAKDLLFLWTGAFGEERPRNAFSLGQLLKYRQGRCGRWLIKGEADKNEHITLWSFTPVVDSEGIGPQRAEEILRSLSGSS